MHIYVYLWHVCFLAARSDRYLIIKLLGPRTCFKSYFCYFFFFCWHVNKCIGPLFLFLVRYYFSLIC